MYIKNTAKTVRELLERAQELHEFSSGVRSLDSIDEPIEDKIIRLRVSLVSGGLLDTRSSQKHCLYNSAVMILCLAAIEEARGVIK